MTGLHELIASPSPVSYGGVELKFNEAMDAVFKAGSEPAYIMILTRRKVARRRGKRMVYYAYPAWLNILRKAA